jgi:hypothetical protein
MSPFGNHMRFSEPNDPRDRARFLPNWGTPANLIPAAPRREENVRDAGADFIQ